MQRWSISNYFNTISHAQFVSLSTHFARVASDNFGVPCRTAIRAYSGIPGPVYNTGNRYDALFVEKPPVLIAEAARPEDLSEQDWKRAKYVEMTVLPENSRNELGFSFGKAQFKGYYPFQGTFTLLGGKPGAKEEHAAPFRGPLFKGRLIGDGTYSNSDPTIPGTERGSSRSGRRFSDWHIG